MGTGFMSCPCAPSPAFAFHPLQVSIAGPAFGCSNRRPCQLLLRSSQLLTRSRLLPQGPSYANGPHHPGFLARTRAALLELDVLLWRGATNLWRNPTLLLMHSLVAALMGVGMGMVFLGVDDSLAGLQNKAGGVFFTLAFFAFCSLTTVDSFLAERAIVLRETQSGYYSAASYLLIKARPPPQSPFRFPFLALLPVGTK